MSALSRPLQEVILSRQGNILVAAISGEQHNLNMIKLGKPGMKLKKNIFDTHKFAF